MNSQLLLDVLPQILSALGGTIVSSIVANSFVKVSIERNLKDLDTTLRMCHDINEKLAVISVKIESLQSMEEMLLDHDKKLYAMELQNDRTGGRDTNGRG